MLWKAWEAGASGRKGSLALLLALTFLERVAAMASALAWTTTWFYEAVGALVAISLFHRGLRRWVRTAVTQKLFEASMAGALTEGVVESTPRRDDGLLAITEAIEAGSRVLVDCLVPLSADVVASIAGIVLLARALDLHAFGIVVAAIAVGLGSLVATRRLTLLAGQRSFAAHVRVFDRLEDAFDGRVEILGAGARSMFFDDARGDLVRWRKETFRAEIAAAFSGRLPLVVAVIVAGALLVARGFAMPAIASIAFLIAVAPSLIGVVRSVHELSKTSTRLQPLAPFLGDNLWRSGTDVPIYASVRWSSVHFAYAGRTVLNDLDAVVAPGEVLAFAGPNGSGKSTALYLAMGLLVPDKGCVHVGEHDVCSLDPRVWGSTVRFLPQRPYLLPRRTVRRAMSFPMAISEDAALDALRRIGTSTRLATADDVLAIRTDALSAGERQRVALARLVAREGQVYVLDEPEANLDGAGVAMVADVVRQIADEGKVVIVAAHAAEVLRIADRVVHLENGSVTSIEERSKGTPPSQKRRAAES